MLLGIARRWWVLLIRGILAIVFGLVAFMWPGLTLAVLVLAFGLYALFDGVTAIVFGLSAGRGRPWWGMVLVGLLGIAAGIVTFLWPAITAVALLLVIAAWAIVHGIMEIVAAIRLRRVIENEWLLGLAGVISIVFGVLLLLWPGAGALAVVWLIGAYAIAFGVIAIVLSLRLRGLGQRLEAGATAVRGPAVGAG